jgi:hypothetical protein
MKLDIQFKELEILVSNMGASQITWESDVKIATIETDWKIILETKGIDVDINDVEIMPNGLLGYRGEQILLYIKEVSGFSQYGLPKFHFYQCGKLNSMKNAGRFERYVVTQRKDGTFLMDKKVGYNHYEKDQIEKLLVCKYCLNWYNRHYRKNHDVYDFNIADFFENFTNTPIIHKPSHTDITAPASGYPENWDSISLERKNRYNWTCEQCGKYCADKTGLHVHHINGVKSDIRESNLKVLCVLCHSKQPNHQHMKRS